MNLDAEAIALSQIQYLVTSLSKKTLKQSYNECQTLIERFGNEAEKHLIRCLFSQIDLTQDNRHSVTQQFLVQYFAETLCQRPNFVSIICYSIDSPLHQKALKTNQTNLIGSIAKYLKLSPLRSIQFALALIHSSQKEVNQQATDFARTKLKEFTSNKDVKNLKANFEFDRSPEILQSVLFELTNQEDIKPLKDDLIESVKVVEDLNPVLRPLIDFAKEQEKVDFVASSESFFTFDIDDDQPPEESAMLSNMAAGGNTNLDSTLPDRVREAGYQFTASLDNCRNYLRQWVSGSEMLSATVARIIGVMVRTHTGLDDQSSLQNMNATGTSLWDKDKSNSSNEPKTWNLEVFIKVVHELHPNLHWKEIIYELDHSGFMVKDRQGLILLIKSLKLGFQVQGFQTPFPVDMFYRTWKHSDGQVSLFQQILRYPEIFNFADHRHHAVAVEVLKAPPDLDSNPNLAPWRSLELIDTLLALAEAGHTHIVKEIFSFPQQHCPDVLTLGLMQINPPLTNFRTELLISNLQVFLASHPNSNVILTHAWHSQTFNLKMIVIHAMTEWYSKAIPGDGSEHARLSRILDIAQDLKALSVMLSARAVPFVIDLAVLASRREYLNLDKWLTDQMREHGEPFVKAVVQYLQRKLPAIMGGPNGPLKEEHLSMANFPFESLPVILFSLQSMTSTMPMSPEVKETIMTMIQNSQRIISQSRTSQPPIQQVPPPPGVLRPPGRAEQVPVGAPVRPTPRQASGNMLPPSTMFPGDPMAGLASQFGNSLNFPPSSQGSMPPSSSSAFSLPNALGPLISGAGGAPGSPNRVFGVAPPVANMESGSSSPYHQLNDLIRAPTSSAASESGMSTGLEQIRAGISNIGNLFPESSGTISKEVEDEANSYFQRIYNHPPNPTLTIDEVLDLLKKFQDSNVQRERDVFNCMIKNLFEEYKYFPQYPEKELHITAQLFGGIIEHGLVSMIPLGLALRFVLDTVRKASDTKMYYFGIAALDRFKARLKDYPQYCQHVSCLPHFKDFPPHLVEWIEHGARSQAPPNKPQGSIAPVKGKDGGAAVAGAPGSLKVSVAMSAAKMTTTVTVTSSGAAATSVASSSAIVRPTATSVGGRPSIANTTNIDTLINARQKAGLPSEPVKAPSDKIQDKVAFIFNNLSLMNMNGKGDELKDILGGELREFSGWLAQYLVMKRASIEPNFHTLYSSFLEVLRSEVLYDNVLKETFSNIKILLSADKSIANFSDRSLLKNLGHWLGLMTLARNIPILMLDLDIKPLIIDAYHKGSQELLYVVPFVAKVLEACAKSKVFKPPCPWTIGIMNLLCELHREHDLKLNLKFEIEVLCKTLSIELNTLAPGNLLKDFDKANQIGIRSFGAKVPSNVANNMGLVPGKGMDAAGFSMTGGVGLPPPQPGGPQRPAMPGAMGVDPMASAVATSMAMMGPTPGSSAFGAGSQQPPGAAGAGMGAALMAAPQQPQNFGGVPPLPTLQQQQTPADVPPVENLQMQQPLQQQQQAAVHSEQQAQQQQQQQQRPPEPKFRYLDISTAHLNGIVPHIHIDSRLTMIKDQPDMIQLVNIAIEKSIQENLAPVIDRAIKIALTTSENIIKQDFALDHDENRMRQAAHHMVRNLTAGMAMITCRDHLLVSIKSNLKHLMLTIGRANPAQAEQINVTVECVATDNVELACAFVQKKAVDKALQEIDLRLQSEFNNRVHARKEGRRYCDPTALTYQAERMPEPIRLQVGGASPKANTVYEEFARNIPGFKPLTPQEVNAITPKSSSSSFMGGAGTGGGGGPHQPISDECVSLLGDVLERVKPFVVSCTTLPDRPHMANLRSLVENLAHTRTTKDTGTLLVLIQKTVENVLEGLTTQMSLDSESLARYRDANLLVIRALVDQSLYGSNWITQRVTQALIEAREDIRYNLDAFHCFVKSGFVSLPDYDKHLSAAMRDGENQLVTQFAMHLCKIYLIEDRSSANGQISETDFYQTIEVLNKIASQPAGRPLPDGIQHLVEMIKISSERLEPTVAGPTAQLHSGIAQAREYEDPPGLLEKTEYLLREWVNAYHSRDAGKDSRQAFIVFVQLMNQHGILKTDDLITRFFRMSTQMCVDLCYRALAEQNNSPTLVRAKCFHTLDAYVRLITLLVKHSGESANTVTKVNLLNKVLGIVAGVLIIDHDMRTAGFQQVPYHRIFIMLFLELNSPDPVLENINFQVLTAYCNMLHILRPEKAPGFAYAWLEIVSHRVFMGRILNNNQKGWPVYAQLLVDLFKFLSSFLRNAELTRPVNRLYRGTLRVLLVLLHDFPEFLCDHHYSFCDVIPPNCIQMRNLILSAFPRNMRLPDPFKVECFPEITVAPRTVANYAAALKYNFRNDLDNYLKNRAPVSFLSELRANLQLNNAEQPGNRYNIKLINALVMHVGTSAIQYIRAKGHASPTMSTIAHSSHMDIFQNLAVDLETEGRYLFLNCIANQLRYPNSHTQYFSCTLLYLFAEANQEAIQEQITRVLLERLIVNRPHPWGLLITFIELIKNPSYKFWEHEFVHCAPEIQKLFESVARSCMVAPLPQAQHPQQRAIEGPGGATDNK